ncbi:MAG: hypothetical protein AAFV53_36730 [Myxococcota bacterium]
MNLLLTLLLVGCAEEPEGLAPNGDADNDGVTNGFETEMGSDPRDADDVPYRGGWAKDAHCRFDVEPTGNDVGEIAHDFALLDQNKDEWHLHDFCDRLIFLEFAGYG